MTSLRYRKSSPRFIARLKKGLPSGAKILLAAIGVASAIITALAATGTVLSLSLVLIIGSGCVAIGLLATLAKGQLVHLPTQIIIEECMDGQYVAEYCTQETLRTANSFTRPYYHREYVSANIAEIWRQKNPQGFVHILNSIGELCACFGVLGIESSFMTQFVKGRVIDNDLLGEDILDISETKKSPSLYISGVVVRDPESMVGHMRACIMVWAMLEYIRKIYGLRRKRTVYALAVSRESQNLLKKCLFAVASPANNRKDKLNLYSFELTKENLDKIRMRLGDFSGVCECRFDWEQT